MKRILLLVALALCLCAQSWAKIVTVDEISFPIDAYVIISGEKQNNVVPLSPSGILRIELRYADTFSNPDNNSYSIQFRAYSDKSRKPESLIFSSVLSGRSQKEVDRNSWGKNTWKEERNVKDKDIKHYIYLSNGFWDTRCCLLHDGAILIVYGMKNEAGTLNKAKSIIIKGDESNWNRLVHFLRRAYSRNIGKTINY